MRSGSRLLFFLRATKPQQAADVQHESESGPL